MSPDLFFWYALAFKVAMTATIVVVVSVAAERSGPFIAALIAALPTAATDTMTTIVAVIATLRTSPYQKKRSGDMVPRRHRRGTTRYRRRALAATLTRGSTSPRSGDRS